MVSKKVNTLDDASDPNIGRNASIEGNNIYSNCKYLPANDCINEENYLGLSIDDPNSEQHYGDLILHKRTINGQEALKINIEMTYVTGNDPQDGDLPAPTIPWHMRNIILIKQ
jgi:hypothetical protein